MRTQNLKTNFANIAIRVVRAFNVPVRDDNLQVEQRIPPALPNEERDGLGYASEETTFTTVR